MVMKAGSFVLLVLLLVSVGAPGMLAADDGTTSEPSEWRSALEAELQRLSAGLDRTAISPTMMRIVIEEASRELGALDPREAAPLVLEEAVRAELRLRLGTPLPRVKAELHQALRVAFLAGGEARERLRALEYMRRRLEETSPRGFGDASVPWWMGPRTGRGSGGG